MLASATSGDRPRSPRCVRQKKIAMRNIPATVDGRPFVRPVTWEGAHSCAPCGGVLRWPFAMRDILATRNGRPPKCRVARFSTACARRITAPFLGPAYLALEIKAY